MKYHCTWNVIAEKTGIPTFCPDAQKANWIVVYICQ